MGILLLLCRAAGAPSWQAECHTADSMGLKRTCKRINETFIIHEGRLVIVDQITRVFPFAPRYILADFQSNVCGCRSRVMLHPFIMNELGLLLCRHVRATAGDTSAGRHWERSVNHTLTRVLLTQSLPANPHHIFSLFKKKIQPLFVHGHLNGMPFTVHVHVSTSARIKRNHSLRTRACKCLLSICV